ncbi:MAG: electron transfer flavoprotein subunit alpha/FixB family protein [Deltaproteobacteria bacterium]|nr:electron transfer flavoprotein subunit alpha/FixB family protein [Deltaproteobacteria bacterium]
MAVGHFQPAGKPLNIQVVVALSAGELDDYDKGILVEASRLAKTVAAEWSVLSFAGASDEAIAALAPYGVEKLTLIEGAEDFSDSLEVQGELIAALAREKGAALVLLPHNDRGEALAPLLAADLDSALFTEAIAYRVEDLRLQLTRQVLGQQVAASQSWDGSRALVLTINPRILSSVVLPGQQPGKVQVEYWRSFKPPAAGATRIIERIPADPQTVDVCEAEVIVSAGLGCNAQSFARVEELTRLLNASLGVTRPAYDLGYSGFERMVGQTGKTVTPRFYLALGISGSMHHLGGIKDSKTVVAVNIDPKAAIFPNADEGFVADLREVLPLLIERLKLATGGAA